jgi:acetyl esterase/lipase
MLPMSKHILTGLFLLALAAPAAHTQQVVPLWPHGTPEPAQTTEPEKDVTKDTDALINGHRSVRIANVTVPTMTVYQPSAEKNTHTAALVFPGGGYVRLAWTGEGTDTCEWLTSTGITCLLVKYRVPQPAGMEGHYPNDFQDLEDAQQAMRLARAHAAEWHIDPAHIGVIGFSAGANLAVLLSNHSDDHHIESTPAARDIPGYTAESNGGIRLNATPDARPAFAIVVYPAYLIDSPDDSTLNPIYAPNKLTPPTFLIQAENDKSYHRNAAVYYLALDAIKVPAELHMYATGGHGFGIHPPNAPEEHWTRLANAWLRRISMLPDNEKPASRPQTGLGTTIPAGPMGAPCPASNTPSSNQQPQANRPATTNPNETPCVP